MTAGILALMHKLGGSLLVLGGLAIVWTPVPLGLIMIAFGLALLAPYFVPVQRLVRHMRRKSAKFDTTMRKFKHKCPPVIKTAIEKTCPMTTGHDKDKATPA